ncbi:uncharacterized protein LOC127001431 [Eriocheir sinensis]|uniref:uncharacterized protein LOC127001431 n=1 Tax=Eriocheir sinensis TaxID=95602 RepID=UPI0021C6B828|nr:uncharacterized protein LOC127001431 [Eriocheir sinensis]
MAECGRELNERCEVERHFLQYHHHHRGPAHTTPSTTSAATSTTSHHLHYPWPSTTLEEEEDDDGRLLIITSTGTGTNVLPTFPIVDLNTLTNANVTLGLGAALLAAAAIAGLTAATITLAILLGIEVKKDKKYDDDYGYSGSSSYASGPSSYDMSSYSIKRSLEEAAKKYL